MELKLVNNARKKVTLEDAIFGCAFNESLVHQVVTAHMAGARAGTKAQKTRAQVSGGGAKPWRQKGTGRARAGTTRSPIWVGGGATFAAKPRSFKQKVNKKMHKGALRSILSELLRQERLHVVDELKVDQPKTKVFVSKLQEMGLSGKLLILTSDLDENLYLAARNLPNVALLDATSIVSDPVSLVKADSILATEGAIKELEGLLK